MLIQPDHSCAEDTLYPSHLESLQAKLASHLETEQFDTLLIASGKTHYYFLDDHCYPFKTNPHFAYWVPFLEGLPECWLSLKTGEKPQLLIYSPDDFWHMTPSQPNDSWCQYFEIVLYSKLDEVPKLLKRTGRVAIIAEAAYEFLADTHEHNPKGLLDRLHFDRARKTPWEQFCLRKANQIAVKGHRSTVEGFEQKLSEFALHQNYLVAVNQQELSLPYNNIIALNEHTAVLHYQHKATDSPEQYRSLLVDAGATYAGYAADITRTVAQGNPLFSALLAGVDSFQQVILDQVKPGVSFIELHRLMHQQLFLLLKSVGIIKTELAAESPEALSISQTFCPHGLGHLLGLQVHDVGGWQQNAQGVIAPPPAPFNFLRLTRVLEPGYVLTIEPGLYFIPSLLAQLKNSSLSQNIDWVLVDSLTPWGGIRVEDNICVTESGHENYTRDAFR